MTRKAQAHKLAPSQRKLGQPMHIQGVGHGTQRCEWAVQMPVAMPCITEDGENSVARHFFDAPVVAEAGAHLPALLGLKSLREKSAVLVLSAEDDQLRLVIPGPGGVEIQNSPGTVTYPLKVAPTGHLLLTCDLFEQTKHTPLPRQQLNFQAMPAADVGADKARSTGQEFLPSSASDANPDGSQPPRVRQSSTFSHGLHNAPNTSSSSDSIATAAQVQRTECLSAPPRHHASPL